MNTSHEPPPHPISATQPRPDAATSREPRIDLHTLPPTINIDTAAEILGCGRSLAYDLARRDEFPCRIIRLGRRYLVPTAELLRVLGLDLPRPPEQNTHERFPQEPKLPSPR